MAQAVYVRSSRCHPQLEGRDYIRKRSKADPDDADVFIADSHVLDTAYETFVSALLNVNGDVIETAQLSKKG